MNNFIFASVFISVEMKKNVLIAELVYLNGRNAAEGKADV